MTKILAFEGIDASGKTLQHSLLRAYLQDKGYTVAEKSFPQYDSFFGSRIAELLGGKDIRADEVDAKSMCLWFALDRWHAFKDACWMKSDYLLINRYVLSNAVYQSIRAIDSKDMLDWVLDLEHARFALPMPDAYIVMDVLPSAAESNMASRAERTYTELSHDVYEQSRSIQERARDKYAEYANRLDNVAVIRCADDSGMLPPEIIHDIIIKELEERGAL